MKILVVGDPHGDSKVIKMKIPKDVDFIICPGDLGKADLARKTAMKYIKKGNFKFSELISKSLRKKIKLEQITSTNKILKKLNETKCFCASGNVGADSIKFYNQHGFKKYLAERKKYKNVRFLDYKIINYKGVKIAGIPYHTSPIWLKEFGYKKKPKVTKLKNFLNKLGKVDILLTHIPPYGYLDKVNNKIVPKHWNGKHAGSDLVLKYVKKHKPKYVICGHIHEAKGKKKLGKTTIINAGNNGDKQIISI